MSSARRSSESFLPQGMYAAASFLLLSMGAASKVLAAADAVASAPLVAQTVHIAIQPGGPRDIIVQVLPDATCTLSAGQKAPAPNGLEIFSDAAGTVMFQLNAPQRMDYWLNCQNDAGTQAAYLLQVTIDPNATPLVRPASPGTPRPALTGDPTIPTDAQLVAAGYPPRPDPVATPEAYQIWLSVVQRAAIILPPSRAVRSNIRNTIHQKDNYVGYSAQNPAAYGRQPPFYDQAIGSWQVPTVSLANSNDALEAAGIWVSLRGCGQADCSYPNSLGTLFQTGFEAVASGSPLYASGNDLFFEWLSWDKDCMNNTPANVTLDPRPTGPPCDYHPTFLYNLPAGTTMFAEVWTGDANGNVTANGGYAWYSVSALLRQCIPIIGCILVPHTAHAGYAIVGNASWPLNGFEADWIVERPTMNGGLTNLARFTDLTMTAAVGYNNGTAQISSDYSTMVLWQMYSNGNLSGNQLAIVTNATSSTMLFHWLRSN